MTKRESSPEPGRKACFVGLPGAAGSVRASAGAVLSQPAVRVDPGGMPVAESDVDAVVPDGVRASRADVAGHPRIVEDFPSCRLVHAQRAPALAAQVLSGVEGLVPVLPDDPQLAAGEDLDPCGLHLRLE